jgi:hypothetical protein
MRRSTILHSDSALSASCAQPRYRTSDTKHITRLVPKYILQYNIYQNTPLNIVSVKESHSENTQLNNAIMRLTSCFDTFNYE